MSQCQGQPWKPGLPAVSPGSKVTLPDRRQDRQTHTPHASPGGSPPDRSLPARGPPRGAPDLPARKTPTCLEVRAVMPRTRPPSREEKDALAAAGPLADWFCKKSPGSAVSVFSTMSLIAAAATRAPLTARPHAQALPRRLPGHRRHFLFV